MIRDTLPGLVEHCNTERTRVWAWDIGDTEHPQAHDVATGRRNQFIRPRRVQVATTVNRHGRSVVVTVSGRYVNRGGTLSDLTGILDLAPDELPLWLLELIGDELRTALT